MCITLRQVGHFFCAFTAARRHVSQKTCLHTYRSHWCEQYLTLAMQHIKDIKPLRRGSCKFTHGNGILVCQARFDFRLGHTHKARRTSAPLIPGRLHTAGQVTALPAWAPGRRVAALSPARLASASWCLAEEMMLTAASHHHRQGLTL